MITILGATGHVGEKIADILEKKGEKLRLVARSVSRLRKMVRKNVEAMAGDAEDTEFLVKAFKDCEAVFSLIPPNIKAEQFLAYSEKVGSSIAHALEIARVNYVVNLSSVGGELPGGTGPIVGLHNQEERLNKIPGLNVLHLRAASFMENLVMNMEMIKSAGMNGGLVKPDLKFSMIATRDIASFAAERLMKRDFSGSSVKYLLGERDLSLAEATTTIGIKIGKPDLRYVQFPYEEAEKRLMDAGFSLDMSRQYIEMSKAFNDGRVRVNRSADNTTHTSFEEFCKEVLVPVYMRKKAA